MSCVMEHEINDIYTFIYTLCILLLLKLLLHKTVFFRESWNKVDSIHISWLYTETQKIVNESYLNHSIVWKMLNSFVVRCSIVAQRG